MPEALGEYYLSHADVALRLQQPARQIVDKIKAGSFGHAVIVEGRDYLVPLSAFNAYVQARRLFDDAGELKPIFARSEVEARRKLHLVRGRAGKPSS